MAVATSSLAGYSSLLLSVVLIALTAANLYLVVHGMNSMNYWFPEGRYTWWIFSYFERYPMGPIDSGHYVNLKYNYATESQILISTGLAIAAGVIGFGGFWITRKNPKAFTSLATISTALVAAVIAFICTIVCLSLAAVKHAQLRENCNAANGRIPDFKFHCTRELAACQILQTQRGGITETNWADNRRCCRETKGARIMLIPFAVLTFLMVLSYAAQLVLVKKQANPETADDRVERLRQDE